jgi:Na+/melibiose symporter-like transporter
MAGIVVTVFLPTFYTQDLGFSMASVGFVLMLARFWDVVTDPIIGYLSDNTRTSIGRRKPWIIASIPVVMFAVYKLFFPAADADVSYLLLWIMVVWFGWTLFNIPYFAWGAELSPRYSERTRITGWRTIAGLTGTLLAIVLPTLGEELVGWGGQIDESMFLVGVIALCLTPLCVSATSILVPENLNFVPSQLKIIPGLKIMLSNGPFRRLVLAFMCTGGASALVAPLFVMFVNHVIVDPTAGAKVVLCYFSGSLVGIPIWVWLARRTDKHISWLVSIGLLLLMYPQYMWLGEGDLLLAMCINFVLGMGGGNASVVPASMKADVIDVDRLESGEDRAGLFFAAWSTASKLVAALGVGISLPVLGWFGFDPAALNGSNELLSLRLWIAVAPVALLVAAALLVVKYPIDRARHAEIRAQLEARDVSNAQSLSTADSEWPKTVSVRSSDQPANSPPLFP